jgi:FMN phosphatase YigB (HAD superfamily)
LPIKAVFFDLGETLCYLHPPTSEILGEFLAERGVAVRPEQTRLAYLTAMTYFSDWAIRVDESERTPEEREAMVSGFYHVLMVSLGLGEQLSLIPELRLMVNERRNGMVNVLFPDVLPALEALRGRGLRLGIISNWDHSLIDTVHTLGLTPYMETVVGSANVGIEKPNPGIFQHALKRLAVAPDEACHVGDIYYMDVLGAKAAGLTPVLIDRHRLQTGVDCLRADSLSELLSMLDEVDE